ncbi:Retinoblastoma-related protein [Nymphaea thermarum]|nr:Retinoblastoma-related protein [Nymphaea thermarum]
MAVAACFSATANTSALSVSKREKGKRRNKKRPPRHPIPNFTLAICLIVATAYSWRQSSKSMEAQNLWRNTGKSIGFAFVTMSSFQDANAVIENLDGSEYGGRNLRVNFSDKPKPREPLYPMIEFKLFVGNLSWSVNSESLMDMFSGYGNVVGARVLYDGEIGRSRRCSFVCFSSKSEMEAALESLNGVAIFAHLDSLSLILLRAPLAKRNSSRRSQGISWAVAHEEAAHVEEREGEEEKEEVASSPPDTKLYFGNLPYSCDSAQLAAIVQEYGSPELVEVLYDRNTGKSRGFAFVTMSSFQDANAVIENLDGSEYGGRNLRVNFSDKPKPREPLYPETEFKLFVGNLSWSVNSESLMDMFSGHANVVGARVLYDGETGRSRGYGFVCFSSKSEMEAALESLNGVELEGRRMRISLALGKRSYYKRAYMDLFLVSGHEKKPSELSGSQGHVHHYLRCGWLLFLSLRIHAFSRFKDLVTCANGTISSDKGVDLIASLCNAYHTSEDDLKKTIEKANNLIVEILHKTPLLLQNAMQSPLMILFLVCWIYILLSIHNQVDHGFTYFQDLMEDHLLSTSMEILEKDYEKAIRDTGELDERCKYESFTSPTKTVRSPPSPPSSPPASITNNNLGLSSSKMAPTPVSITMTTAKWLWTVIGPLPPKPSPELQHFLSSCDRDLTEDVMHRVNIILEAIFPSSIPGERCIAGSLQTATQMDSIWAEQRTETLKSYYRVLVTMCRAESQTLHSKNLTSLLTNDRFHRCMLACSAELVLATHKTVTMMFPAVLERTGITAFDLSKVIESFVRHEETLPRELKRHLNTLEERLLESLAWERGSSMYNSLIVAKPSLGAEINRLGLLAEPMPSLDAIALQQNITAGSLQPLPALQKHETSFDNHASTSPKKVISDPAGVLVERNSFTSPVKEHLNGKNLRIWQRRLKLRPMGD